MFDDQAFEVESFDPGAWQFVGGKVVPVATPWSRTVNCLFTRYAWPVLSKDPDDILDYAFDWSTRLYGDEIATSIFEAQSGLVLVGLSSGSRKTQIIISGGTVGGRYRVTNRITTHRGRRMDKTFTLRVRNR